MKRLLPTIAVLALLVLPQGAWAQNSTLAVCGESSGHAYYPHIGIVDRNDAGWSDDRITGGRVTLVKLANDEFDILFADASGAVTSTVQSGGHVFKLRQGPADFSFLATYPNATSEIYTFMVENDGNALFTLLHSKGGNILIHKSAVYVGKCSFVNFE